MGDEGKGITTDFLSTRYVDGIVVRFSGGQQAGHTVHIGDKQHTFSTFGSGTGRGLPTYLSEYCTFYPPNALNEYNVLLNFVNKVSPLYVHPLAKLTSYWDVAWGRLWERIYAHGSCGIGVGATMKRQEQSPYKLHVCDLLYPEILKNKLTAIGRYYGEKLREFDLDENEVIVHSDDIEFEKERFESSIGSVFMQELLLRVRPYSLLSDNYSNLIFEGSQGILLDMEHGIFPNVTYSNTTSKNAISICNKLNIPNGRIDIYYVTRCYFTRHGNGWFPSVCNEIELSNNQDEHNTWNEWQQNFRVGELDYKLLKHAIEVDASYSDGCNKHLVVTCLDQRKDFKFDYVGFTSSIYPKVLSIHESWSPDSKDFKMVLF